MGRVEWVERTHASAVAGATAANPYMRAFHTHHTVSDTTSMLMTLLSMLELPQASAERENKNK